MSMHDNYSQNLKKIGPTYSTTAEKQQQMVQMIKRGEVKLQMRCDVNPNIQGLRKKREVWMREPAHKRWWDPFSSMERNG